MRKGTKQTGKFQIQEGMAFTMPSIYQDYHPTKTKYIRVQN